MQIARRETKRSHVNLWETESHRLATFMGGQVGTGSWWFSVECVNWHAWKTHTEKKWFNWYASMFPVEKMLEKFTRSTLLPHGCQTLGSMVGTFGKLKCMNSWDSIIYDAKSLGKKWCILRDILLTRKENISRWLEYRKDAGALIVQLKICGL